MDTLRNILNIVIHFTTICYLISAAILFIRRKNGNDSRIKLACSIAIWGVLMLSSVISHLEDATTYKEEILSIKSLNVTLFAFLSMFLYPIDVIRKGVLNLKNIFYLYSTWILFNLVLLITQPEFRYLNSFDEVILYIGEYNVWLRLTAILCIIPMAIILLYIPYRHKQNGVNIRWVHWFCVGLLGHTTIYVIWVLTVSDSIRLIMQLYSIGFCLIVTYQELFIRIYAPVLKQKKQEDEHTKTMNERVRMSPQWQKVVKILSEERIWRNPDLTLVEFAAKLGTNRTSLSNLIREAGYDGFYSLINTCRIKEFIYIIEHEEISSIQEIFFYVGFRSKTTAIRYFRQETGTTPSEYLQKKLLDKKMVKESKIR